MITSQYPKTAKNTDILESDCKGSSMSNEERKINISMVKMDT